MKKLIQWVELLLQKVKARGPHPHPDRSARAHAFVFALVVLLAAACAETADDEDRGADEGASAVEDGGAPSELPPDAALDGEGVDAELLQAELEERRVFGRVAPVPLPRPPRVFPPLVGPGPK